MILARGLNDPVDINLIARPLQKETPRRVPQNIKVAIVHGPQDAFRLGCFSQSKPRMNRTHRVVEFFQEVVRIVERSISQNIDFGRLEKPEAAQLLVQCIDVPDLFPCLALVLTSA